MLRGLEPNAQKMFFPQASCDMRLNRYLKFVKMRIGGQSLEEEELTKSHLV